MQEEIINIREQQYISTAQSNSNNNNNDSNIRANLYDSGSSHNGS
jgi:hypothetical protein